ncbi:hypothetical protein GF377_06365, partial [candidate division GN15 bacterium]|nr:hypothetical protein [candidate division GN15 bacterium]
MKQRHTSISIAMVLSALMVILATCSEDSPTNSDDTGGSTEVTVTPATTDAPSGSWVGLAGLPSGSSGFYGVVTSAAKADDTGYLPIVRSDSGDFMIVPFNPSDPIGGGQVQVVITDGGDITAEPVTLTLDSLPPAPGEFDAVVSLLQDILTEQLRIAGLSRDSLSYGSASEVPLSAVPYVLAHAAIDSPDNPNSLRALADGPVPYLDSAAIDIDFLDRVTAVTGLRDYLAEQLAALDTVTTSFATDYRVHRRVGSARSTNGCIPAPDYGIEGCGALSNAMRQQFALELAAVSVEEGLDKAATTGALLAISVIPGGAPVAAGIGVVLWTDGVIKEGYQNMLPSEFVDAATLFDPSQQDFPEDFTEAGEWTQFRLTASSKGWTLDKVALEAVLQVLGASGAGDAIGKTPGTFAKEAEDAMNGFVQGQLSGAVVNELTDETGVIQVCANTWESINCVGTDFSTVTALNGLLDIDSMNLEYEPTQVGEDILKIETKNVFGGGNSVGSTIPINTNRIELFLDPYQAAVDTSDTVTFTIRVEHAEDERVVFSLENGGVMDSDNSSAAVITPNAPWDPPLILSAKSLAGTGLRQGVVDSDPRVDTAYISYEGNQFLLTPESICLQPGQSESFTIVVVEGQAESVEWFTDPLNTGTIVPSGTQGASYTAPDEMVGQIELYAVVNGEDTLVSNIDVSDCACYWTFGGDTQSATGVLSQATDLGGGLLVTLNKAKGDISPPHVSFTLSAFNGIGFHDSVNVIYTDATPEAWVPADTAVPKPT